MQRRVTKEKGMLLITAFSAFAIEPTTWYDKNQRITCPATDQSHVWDGQRVTRADGKWTVTIVASGKKSPPYDWVGNLPLPWDPNPSGHFVYEALCGQTRLTVTSGQEQPCTAPPIEGAR